jgi:hypothetical protein
MLSSDTRIGKAIYDLSLLELIEEYKQINVEGSKFVMVALELNLLDGQREDLDKKCNEFQEYQKELACEFIGRFLK